MALRASYLIASPLVAICAVLAACGGSGNSNARTNEPAGGSSGAENSGGDDGSGATGGKASGATGGDTGSGGKGSGGKSAAGSSGSATSGAGNGSGANGGAMQNPVQPPRMVANCEGLGDVGEWENVTPPFDMLPTALAVDPVNSGTVYFGTSPGGLTNPTLGIWKTTDCGANWVHVNTGTNSGTCSVERFQCSENLDRGRQWIFAIDPIEPQTLYVNNGYGTGDLGLMKSTDGGVNWWQMWPPCGDPQNCYDTKNAFAEINAAAPGFIGDVLIDPHAHEHLLINFHADCRDVTVCFGESFDGGRSWRVVNGDPGMGSAHESRMAILDNSESWMFIAGDIWLTNNSGQTWRKVSDAEGGGNIYRAKDGTYYAGALDVMWRSADNGETWAQIPDTGPIIQGLVGDGETMFVSRFAAGFPWGENLQPYMTSPENDGLTWTPYPSPPMKQGAIAMDIDKGHNLLWSVNSEDGIWRVRIK
jgi:hypothetical protein